MTAKADKVVVGKINAVYGIKGWVKVYSFTEPLDRIFSYAPWHIKKGSKSQVLELSQMKKHGKGLVVLADGYTDRTEAESLIGSEILVDQSQFSELEDGEFYWHQIEGLKVFNEADELLGEVSHMIQTGANDVLSVQPCDGSLDDRERLIPYVETEVIKEIDLETGRVLVKWAADF